MDILNAGELFGCFDDGIVDSDAAAIATIALELDGGKSLINRDNFGACTFAGDEGETLL